MAAMPTPVAVPTLAEGACQFTVDGKTLQGDRIASLATGTPGAWQLQCRASDATSLLTINMAGNGFAAPGTYNAGTAPSPSGIASFSEQDSKSPGSIAMYRQDTGWTLTLTQVDSVIVGAASFVGVLGGKPSKPVTVAFHFKLQ